MGILLVILTAFAYGIVAAVVLHFINSILVVFGIRNLLEQPFILEFLRAFNLPEHSFAVSCVWIGLLFIAGYRTKRVGKNSYNISNYLVL